MKLASQFFYAIEVGSARSLVRLIPLVIVVLGIIGFYNLRVYKGLNDMQSMDNAQLARQIVTKRGFTTFFIRPYALTQYNAFRSKQGQTELFPLSVYSSTTPRSIPDTYNSPGYPVLLGGFLKVLQVNFDDDPKSIADHRMFSGDRWIPPFNQVFILLTAGLLFFLGYRLFDDRVAWMASVVFITSDFVWKFSLQAIPTNLLMFLAMLLFLCAAEIYRVAERRTDPELGSPVSWGWLLIPVLAVVLAAMCWNSLLLLILLFPLVLYLGMISGKSWFWPFIVLLVTPLLVAPWFYHWYKVCGNPLGSNMTLGLLGQGEYTGNQVYTATTIPSYNQLFSSEGAKEYNGFVWYFQRGWDLLGSNPMVLLFVVSILHEFRRPRVKVFRWLVVGSALAIVAMTNLAEAQPDPVSSWNLVAILLPCMILIGSAFFFTLLDRMTTQLPLLTGTIVVATLATCLAPMLLVLTTPNYALFNYPPYLPNVLSYLGRAAPSDEWITSDVPWALAWYGDRPSLWMPDSLTDFEHINDDICPSYMMLITPQTFSKPFTNFTTGELKEWFPILLNTGIPDTFPLRSYQKFPSASIDYTLLSRSPLFQAK